MANSENYSIHTRHRNDLHFHHTNLANCQTEVYSSVVKIFNNPLPDIKIFLENLKDLKEF